MQSRLRTNIALTRLANPSLLIAFMSKKGNYDFQILGTLDSMILG